VLPQHSPFRLVERRADDAVLVRLASDAVYLRADPCPLTLVVEILAQAALLLAGEGAAAAEPVFLGGVDEARLLAPLRPGDELRARAAVVGSAGGLTRLATRLERDGEVVAEATLLLVRGARG
jgi:3-hydroxymyristoyl/3-hydroxydecanoyl-(acyl carrier protein) dehydratase